MSKKEPKAILKFCPDPDFEEQFADFVETVLSWTEHRNKSKTNKQTHEKR